MKIYYRCSECGDVAQQGLDELGGEGSLYCPDHPDAVIDSVVGGAEGRVTRYEAARRALELSRDAHAAAVEDARSPQETTGRAVRQARAERIADLAEQLEAAKRKVEWLRTHPSGELLQEGAL